MFAENKGKEKVSYEDGTQNQAGYASSAEYMALIELFKECGAWVTENRGFELQVLLRDLAKLLVDCEQVQPLFVSYQLPLLTEDIQNYKKSYTDELARTLQLDLLVPKIKKVHNELAFKRAMIDFHDVFSVRAQQTSVHPEVKPLVQKSKALFDETLKLWTKVDPVEDLPRLTQSLNYATKVLKAPDDQQNLQQFTNFAEELKEIKGSGKRSWGYILGGAALAVVGTVLVLGSAATAVASFGAATPLSIAGTVGGTAAIIIGATAIATGTCGATIALESITLSWLGRRKGLTQAKEDFAKAAGRARQAPEISTSALSFASEHFTSKPRPVVARKPSLINDNDSEISETEVVDSSFERETRAFMEGMNTPPKREAVHAPRQE